MIGHSTFAWLEAQKKTGRAEVFAFRFDRAPLTPKGWFGKPAPTPARSMPASCFMSSTISEHFLGSTRRRTRGSPR